MAKYRIVRVVWIDPEAHDEWEDVAEMRKWADEPVRECEGVGILYRSSRDKIVLVAQNGTLQMSHAMKIPKCNVVEMEHIGDVEDWPS